MSNLTLILQVKFLLHTCKFSHPPTYTDLSGKSVPLNYRIYNKQEGKTKNDYLREMIAEILSWGLEPDTVTTDAWYSSKDNVKFFKDKGLTFLTGIAKNRSCSVDGKNFTQVQNLEIPEIGLVVHLKNFGKVKVFRKSFKNETHRYYMIYIAEENALLGISRTDFNTLHSIIGGLNATTELLSKYVVLVDLW
ncbi:MAG: transposase [Nostoc desertorum CM1-VF14]|nr:transposase [Nostoc desertorum CM1-VF14]